MRTSFEKRFDAYNFAAQEQHPRKSAGKNEAHRPPPFLQMRTASSCLLQKSTHADIRQ
jgi:hypothetical protein